MKKLLMSTLFIILFFNTQSQNNLSYSEYSLIVKFNDNIEFNLNYDLNKFNIDLLDNLNYKNHLKEIKLIGGETKKIFALKFKNVIDVKNTIIKYLDLSIFEYVEPDFIGRGAGVSSLDVTNGLQIIPDDQYWNLQWGLYNDGSFSSQSESDADVDMELAWDIETGSSNIIVAVLDSGIKLDHPEFDGRLWESNSQHNGYDFVNDDLNPWDDHGHGTNVAGILAASSNNSIGYSGVDWNCKIMPLKVLNNENWGYYSWWVNAIYYAVENGANVINMSLGGSDFSQAMQEAVNFAVNNNVSVFACMMNYNSDQIYYPAGYLNSFAVGSTDPNDSRSSPFFWGGGSSYGSHIDVVAPGNFIYGISHNSDTNYNTYWGGTSQASPLVSGIGSLLLSQDSTRTPYEIYQIIRDTAEDQVGDQFEDIEGFDIFYGFGRVNANNALSSNLSLIDNTKYDLLLYPNPTTDKIFLSKNILIDFVIFDSIGNNITYGQTSGEIDVSNLIDGIYFLKYDSENKGDTIKFIKN